MNYKNIRKAIFINRPNRFIANIDVDGEIHVCHVKNTGRCRELLIPGAEIFVQEFNNPARKTNYDLISVYKGKRLINMDSQAPNKIFHEWVKEGRLFKNPPEVIKPEFQYNNSRFDFYIEAEGRRILIEVKGVTLEEEGVVMFPDAPTERGLKHINELAEALEDGYECYVVFIIQMKDVIYFTPNYKTHEEFGNALKRAHEKGVGILAVDCIVTENNVHAADYVYIRL